MKTIDEYLALPYKMEIVPDPAEGGVIVSFPDLPGCISAGETLQSAVENAEDAKKHGWRPHSRTDIKSSSRELGISIPDSLSSGFPKVCTGSSLSTPAGKGSA